MKAQVITPGSAPKIPREARAVIFARRPSLSDFTAVMKVAPWINTFMVCESYFESLSKNVQQLCDIRKVRLVCKNTIQGKKEHLDGSLVDIEIKGDEKR
jgi:hypothetical protein